MHGQGADCSVHRAAQHAAVLGQDFTDAQLGQLIGSAPAFTCSYGITNARVALDAAGIIELAEAGVRRAKELGGDEIVYADETLSSSS